MALTVYAMGDLPIFTSILNGTAMVFNSSLFDPGQGAGVVVTGLLLTCVWMILSALSQGKIDHKPLIFVILLFYGGVMPKERLQVEDIYTSQITAVDNIPLIVALPASIVASLTKSLTDKVETSFSATNGSYISMGAEGFANPLKMLLTLRDPVVTKRTFPYLSASIIEYIRYCAPTDAAFSVKSMSSASDIVAYLNGLNVSGIMTYYDSNNAMGIGTSCADGKNRLVADSQQVKLKTEYDAMAKISTAGELPKNANGASMGATVDGLNQAYNGLTAGILGNLQTSQQFMVNAIAFTSASQGIDCINQPTGANMSSCLSDVMTRQAMEQANVDAAAQSSIFTKTMIPGMNILMALFYAFSPIILAIAFMAGPHGIKMAIGLIMFGVWTQSWLPVAAVINYMIELQTQFAFSNFPSTGVTLQNYMQFYSIISTKLGMASTLMSMTPVITFALLSGSAFAVTQLAGGLSAKDYNDEKLAAPSLGQQDAAVKNGSLVAQSNRVDMQASDGGIYSDTVKNSAYSPFSKLNLSETQRKSAEHSQANYRTAQSSLDQSLANTLHSGMTQQQTTDWVKQTQAAVTATDGHAAAEVKKWMAANKDVENMSKEDKELLELGLGLKVGGSGATADKIFGMMKNKSVAKEIVNSKDFTAEQTRAEREESSRGFAKNLRTNAASVLSNDNSNQLMKSVSNAEKAEVKLSRSEARAAEVGLSNVQDLQTLGTLLHSSLGSTAGKYIDDSVPEESKQKYLQEENRLIYQMPEHMRSNGGVRAAAKLQALGAVNQDALLDVLQANNLAGMHSNKEPAGADVGAINKPLFQQAGSLPDGRLAKVDASTSKAARLQGSQGAPIKAVESAIADANKHIEQALKDKEHLGTSGQMGHDRIVAEQEAATAFLRNVEQQGWVNEHGDIAGMANFAEAARQYSNFEHDYPAAAAAIALTPVGRTIKMARGAHEAETALVAATKAAETAKGAKNVAAAGKALERAKETAEKARESYHQSSAILAGSVSASSALAEKGDE